MFHSRVGRSRKSHGYNKQTGITYIPGSARYDDVLVYVRGMINNRNTTRTKYTRRRKESESDTKPGLGCCY